MVDSRPSKNGSIENKHNRLLELEDVDIKEKKNFFHLKVTNPREVDIAPEVWKRQDAS